MLDLFYLEYVHQDQSANVLFRPLPLTSIENLSDATAKRGGVVSQSDDCVIGHCAAA
jgi:hypothetical protein